MLLYFLLSGTVSCAGCPLVDAVARYRNAREFHPELIESLDGYRLAFSSAASRAYIIDNACVSAYRVSVNRVVD